MYGGYVVNLDDLGKSGTHWVAIFIDNGTATYFDSFGIEHIPMEIMEFLVGKNILSNIYRVQAYDSVLCGYFCIKFLEHMFRGGTLAGFTSMFSVNDFALNDKIILKMFDI